MKNKISVFLILFLYIACSDINKNISSINTPSNNDNIHLIIKKHGNLSHKDTIVEIQDTIVTIRIYPQKNKSIKYYKTVLQKREKKVLDSFIRKNFNDTINYYFDSVSIELFYSVKNEIYRKKSKICDLNFISELINNIFINHRIKEVKIKNFENDLNIIGIINKNKDTINLSFFDQFLLWKALAHHKKFIKIDKNRIANNLFKYRIFFNNIGLPQNKKIKNIFINDKKILLVDSLDNYYLIDHHISNKIFNDIIQNKRSFQHRVIY